MGHEVLKEIKQRFIDCASGLGDYESISKTDLANGYCDADEAGDETKRSQYYAALMLRYWYKIYEYAKSCASMRLEIEDFVGWMDDSFYWAFRYRRWRDPDNPLHNDPNGPDKVFNQCFFSTRGRYYQHSNKEVRKVNWTSSSLNALEESVGDHADVLGRDDEEDYEREIVKQLLSESKIMDALVVDGILYQDVFDEIKEKDTMKIEARNEDGQVIYDDDGNVVYEEEEYFKYSYQFNLKKLVKHIKYLNDKEQNPNFTKYFVKQYDLKGEDEEKFLRKINSISKNGLSKVVQRTLYNLSRDKNILNLLEAR